MVQGDSNGTKLDDNGEMTAFFVSDSGGIQVDIQMMCLAQSGLTGGLFEVLHKHLHSMYIVTAVVYYCELFCLQ